MKRQRDLSAASSDNETFTGIQNPCGNDCYNEVMREDDDGCILRNSWLNKRDSIHENRSIGSMSVCEDDNLADEIKSLSQQLIQVKRRLWPAAERCADVWDSNPSNEFWSARSFANPMEGLGESRNNGLNQMFINRSAIKLANIDAILDFGLTKPIRNDSVDAGTNKTFLFADLCGAPGGFSEYIMKRIRSNPTGTICRGYGMSLVGTNEHGKGATWRLQNLCQHGNSFSINYNILYGSDGSGDIYNWRNVESFLEEIENDLRGQAISQRKMNLVVADGGFDAQRDSECQEELAQKLVLCEFAASLEILGTGAVLIVKLFGCQTKAIRTAIRSLSDFFETIEMIKPISSRPASSERYIVFTGFKGQQKEWKGGRSWMHSILVGNGTVLQNDQSAYSSIDKYLDQFDRDMLVLNLKACFAILSRLERKTGSASLCGKKWKHEDENDREKMNIKMYKHLWRLFI